MPVDKISGEVDVFSHQDKAWVLEGLGSLIAIQSRAARAEKIEDIRRLREQNVENLKLLAFRIAGQKEFKL